ncbi:hypothetical protein TNCV_3880501 [Trichonephila clavipes]|nr:hypothetical protein TNCV_3880501 [Trichonephila clavipes]
MISYTFRKSNTSKGTSAKTCLMSPRHSRMCGRDSLVVKVTDSGLASHEFEPSATEDPPCREAGAVWKLGEGKGCQLRRRPRYLTMIRNNEVRR